MQRLQEEAKAFGTQKLATIMQASRLAATQLVCGIDLSAALAAENEVQVRYIRRIERVIERERLKGMRRHWSYDLNRHIALKQALDLLRERQPGQKRLCTAASESAVRTKQNGARRRRGST
ncbi:MAG: cytoplasmic protein [Mesorhizobium sp.]